MTERRRRARSQPIAAGVVASVVGFAGSATVVLAGLRGVGATPEQAASGLLAVSVAMGLLSIWFGVRTRLPIAIAWSTSGAALLITAGVPDGGWSDAIGAFLVVAALTLAAAYVKPLARAVAAIPSPIASALLAGVLLPLCLAPARAMGEIPALAGPTIAVWFLVFILARRWAVPAAFVAAVVALAIDGSLPALSRDLLPHVAWTTPTFGFGAAIGIGIPLFIVTMASQNVTGSSVLRAFGYEVDLPRILRGTSVASAAAAPFGAHAVNLAAITAALIAGPEADPEPQHRWQASVAGGATYVVLGALSGVAAAVVLTAPHLLVETLAGVALLPSLAGALGAAMDDPNERMAAAVVVVVSASGVVIGGITAPFWGLIAGLVFRYADRLRAHSSVG